MANTKNVKFRRTTWRSVVKAADPKPTRDVEYEFSNGKQFLSKRSS